MKKILFVMFFILLFSSSAIASNFANIKYKNIAIKDKISYNAADESWNDKTDKKRDLYFIKTKGFGDFYDYMYPNKSFAFTTDCEYEFIFNGNFIGYSNSDLKFYNIKLIGGKVFKQELTKKEVEELFPDYKIIEITEFSKIANAYKIKKHAGILKIIILNNTENKFHNFRFSSGNAEFEQYKLSGFINVTKPGMIQFSQDGEHISGKNCYVLLVR